MQTVAVVGVGLIGSSFGLALRKIGFKGPILGVSSPGAIKAGIAAGAIDRSATLKEAADNADFIYLAQPVDRIIDTLGWLGPMARTGTLITDAGSTKTAIVKAAALNLQYATFIGGHPMAGKETRGAQSADASLFGNKPYVLTPNGTTVPSDFRQLLQSIGANVIDMTPEDHDATVALSSHLPQLLSTVLAAALAQQQNANIDHVFGSGLLDMTRLALSPADLWSSIFATNKENVVNAIDLYTKALADLKQHIAHENIERTFACASEFSRHLRQLSDSTSPLF